MMFFFRFIILSHFVTRKIILYSTLRVLSDKKKKIVSSCIRTYFAKVKSEKSLPLS